MLPTLAVCTLTFMVSVGGIAVQTTADVEGKILRESEYKYLVDFREGLKKYPKTVNPHMYDKTLVNKDNCVKE